MSDDPADYERDVIVHAEPIAFRPQSFELAVPRTRTRHTIPIPRETMRELVFPVGTPAAGVHVERDTAEFDRAELAQLVEATRPPAHEHAIAARMAMTADVAAPARKAATDPAAESTKATCPRIRLSASEETIPDI